MSFNHLGTKLCVLKAKVNPSQKSPDKAHEAWIIATARGEIISSHCTCMAGLGEGCSHVAAILFKIESAIRLGYTSVTSQECRWNETFCSKIEPAEIVDTEFQRPKRKRSEETAIETSRRKSVKAAAQPQSSEDKEFFLTELKKCSPNAVVFSSLEQLETTGSISCRVVRKLPSPLTSLYDPKYLKMNKQNLGIACKEIFRSISITKEEAAYLEECTRLQSESTLWYDHRKGRITASKFYSVFRASSTTPPASLIQSLLQRSKFDHTKVPALNWGLNNEDNARICYTEMMEESHVNFRFFPCGLYINPSFPHLGATPDGIISCDCCGTGLMEIKCPYKYRDMNPKHVIASDFYLKANEADGLLSLRHNHQYYYQVQGQLAVCEKDFCDFICWTPLGIHVERIVADPAMFEDVRLVLDKFFKSVLLPRLLTAGSTPTSQGCTDQVKTKFCLCGGDDVGKMVACDNTTCPIEWFHFLCVGLARKPRGKWYCSNCK